MIPAAEVDAPVDAVTAPVLVAPLFTALVVDVPGVDARRYADAGLPPSVSASAARNAYGTLVIGVRGRSTSPTPAKCRPSQRASPDAKMSTGIPSGCVAPRSR